MLIRLLTQLLSKRDCQKMEEHFRRQADAAEAEVAATSERLRTATRAALAPLDSEIHERYQRHLRQTGNPALAEMATIREVQSRILEDAFSLLDFGQDGPIRHQPNRRSPL